MFAKTHAGNRFFTQYFPALIKALQKIGNEMEGSRFDGEVEPERVYGKFEKMTDEDNEELATLQLEFDEWFGKLLENFELLDHFNDDQIQGIKNLTRHAWNANK